MADSTGSARASCANYISNLTTLENEDTITICKNVNTTTEADNASDCAIYLDQMASPLRSPQIADACSAVKSTEDYNNTITCFSDRINWLNFTSDQMVALCKPSEPKQEFQKQFRLFAPRK